jgi:putative component of toxin-antitoxin plasmid stabilization module
MRLHNWEGYRMFFNRHVETIAACSVSEKGQKLENGSMKALV